MSITRLTAARDAARRRAEDARTEVIVAACAWSRSGRGADWLAHSHLILALRTAVSVYERGVARWVRLEASVARRQRPLVAVH